MDIEPFFPNLHHTHPCDGDWNIARLFSNEEFIPCTCGLYDLLGQAGSYDAYITYLREKIRQQRVFR